MVSVSDVMSKLAYDILSKEDGVKEKPMPKDQMGIFSGQNADQIVKTLLKDSKNDVGKAIQKLQFYINRAGEKLPEKEKIVVNRAKKMLEEKEKKQKK